MNYSIIFTEISFSPETSILLQMIRIIPMTIWIIQYLIEKGGQSVRSVSKVVYTMRLTQTKTCLDKSPPGGRSGRPPPYIKKGWSDSSSQCERKYNICHIYMTHLV